MRTRARKLAVVATAAALAVTACSDPTQNSAGDEGGAGEPTTANIYLYQEPTGFNPLAPFAGGDQLVMSLVYDNLVTTNPDNEFEPRLATDWEVSEDATTYTFTLADGLTWSDGETFDADDVVFSYNLYADPEVASGQSGRLAGVAGYAEYQSGAADALTGVTAVDERTVEFTLTEPDAGFLSLIGFGAAFYILPEHILGEVPPAEINDHEFFRAPTVGMGPYTLTEFRPDQDVQLAANPEYRTDVGIDNLVLKLVTSDVATAQLGTGEIDLVQVSPTDLDSVQDLPDVEVASAPAPGFTRAAVNTADPALADLRVRQAMLMAIDRQGIIDGILGGEAELLNTSVMTDWALPDDLQTYDYDPEAAKALLAAAGWDPGTEVRLSWVPGQRDRDQMATVMIENLQAVGINAVSNQVEAGALTASYSDKSYQLALFGGGVYPPDPATVSPILACDQAFPVGGNIPFLCDDAIDAGFAAGAATTDQDARAAAYQDVARAENAAVPYLWINRPNTVWARSGRLQGFQPHGDFSNGFWNAADWSIA